MTGFKRIGLVGRPDHSGVVDSLQRLLALLATKELTVVLDDITAGLIDSSGQQVCKREELSNHCDLVIVVGGDGSMFEFELIYHPTTTTGGVEGLKRPQPDGVRGVPMRNQGGQDKELYRWHWLLKNNRDVDDYSGMINLLNTMGMSTAAYNRVVEEVIDVDQFLRTFAFLNLMGIGDNYGTHGSGAWHNAIFYIRPTDGKAMFFPWDMDFTFTNSATSGVTPSSDLNKMIAASPGNKRAYYGHLLDMILTTFNTRYMT